MSALDELIHYCNEKKPIGAMLLTGEWGCGKTYLIESDLTKALEHTHIIVKVSLFGITDVGTLRSTIRQKWFEACTPFLSKLREAKKQERKEKREARREKIKADFAEFRAKFKKNKE